MSKNGRVNENQAESALQWLIIFAYILFACTFFTFAIAFILSLALLGDIIYSFVLIGLMLFTLSVVLAFAIIMEMFYDNK
jgi:hypothetical protein